MARDLIDETLPARDPNLPKPRGLLPVPPELEASIASVEANIAKEHGIQIAAEAKHEADRGYLWYIPGSVLAERSA
jgi:hypothetical protein